MSTTRCRRLAPWLLVLALAAPHPAAALSAFEPGALFARLQGFLSAIWMDNGCDADPNGRCAAVVRDNGCDIDSNGRCIQRANGCDFDPDGRCAAVERDNGCDMDPNGSCKQ
jgi:hypothetical protein